MKNLVEGKCLCYTVRKEQSCYKVVASQNFQKRGGGAYGNVFVSGFDSVCDIFNYTACLHR